MMKIYTRTGDKGYTSLAGGQRVAKHDARIESYGTVDELISFIGLISDQKETDSIVCNNLYIIQEKLMVCAAGLAADIQETNKKIPEIQEKDILLLEKEIDKMDATLKPLTSFILPGGHTVISYCHIARTVCRRAERRVSVLHDHEKKYSMILQFLNRLSDYLFTLSRYLSKKLNVQERTWNS